MGRRILAIVMAAVIALVGAVLVLLYARGADNRAVAAASPRTVFVSSATVPAGTTLKEAMRLGLVKETTAAAKAVPTGALAAVDDTNNQLLALADIAPGQYLLSTAFGETPIGERAIQVPSGRLAVSVQLSDPARVGTFVTPGSYLTIFASYEMKRLGTTAEDKAFNEAEVTGTSVLLDNVQVIGMGEDPLQGPAQGASNGDEEEGDAAAQGQQAPSFLVTLSVTPEQATRLVHGITQYELYAGLRGAEMKVDPNMATDDLRIFRAAS